MAKDQAEKQIDEFSNTLAESGSSSDASKTHGAGS